jgi:hypothetical protein
MWDEDISDRNNLLEIYQKMSEWKLIDNLYSFLPNTGNIENIIYLHLFLCYAQFVSAWGIKNIGGPNAVRGPQVTVTLWRWCNFTNLKKSAALIPLAYNRGIPITNHGLNTRYSDWYWCPLQTLQAKTRMKSRRRVRLLPYPSFRAHMVPVNSMLRNFCSWNWLVKWSMCTRKYMTL